MNELVQLAIDVVKHQGDVTKYSKKDAMEVFRQELITLNGGSEKLTPKSFRDNPKLFAIVEEALDILIHEGLTDQFDFLVDTQTIEYGDAKVYTLEDPTLWDVGIVADGVGSLKRNRLDSGEFTVKTTQYGIAVYEELARMLAGKIDFAKLVERLQKSYENKIKNEIYLALWNSYNTLGSTYQATGSFSETVMDTLIAHIEASTGMDCMILGTKVALGKVTLANQSDAMKDRIGAFGFYGNYKGTEMLEIKQAHKVGSTQFAIDDNFLLVLPKGTDKFIKLVLEGDSLIIEGNELGRKDLQKEYTFIKKAGIGVVTTNRYGIYRLT